MKEGAFAFYKGRPVGIQQIMLDGQRAVVRHIQRDLNSKQETVLLADLKPFTKKTANAAISEYNMRKHAIEECLSYYSSD